MQIIFKQDLNAHLKTNKLMKIDKILDWGRIESILDDVHSHLGPTGYDVVKMFKCLLIQSWHNLSDPGLEESLRLRLDFLQFAGFNFGVGLKINRFRIDYGRSVYHLAGGANQLTISTNLMEFK